MIKLNPEILIYKKLIKLIRKATKETRAKEKPDV